MKLRPMSEAPLNVPLLMADPNRPSGWTYGEFSTRDSMHKFNGFYEIATLLHAAETMAAITPEGCEFASAFCKYPGAVRPTVEVTFHRIAPPVEYQYIAEHKYRAAKVGDFLLQGDGDWVEVDESLARVCGDEPRLCFRRVEVKR